MTKFSHDDALRIAEHLRWLRLLGTSEGYIYGRANALKRMRPSLPDGLLAATPNQLHAWRMSLAVSPDTVASYATHTREFYRWLVREGIRADDPAALIPVPKVRRRIPRPISTDDLAYALATAPERVRPVLVLAAWCGLRAMEIALLCRECVLDTTSPPVLLVVLEATKGGYRERTVPLHPFVLNELHAMPMPSSGWIIRRRDGHPGPCKPWLISHLANDHLHEQGITATLHQLRHWFGTQTYQAKRDLRVVQELLGHASPSTTAGYAAYDRAEAAGAVNALPVPSALRAIPGQPRGA